MNFAKVALLLVSYSLFLLANARRIAEHRFNNQARNLNIITYPSTSDYRYNNDLPNQQFATEGDEPSDELEPVVPHTVNIPASKKLLVFNGKSNNVGSGRTFKHLLLLKGLGDSNYGSGHGGNGGGSGGAIFYLYNPLNLTNINNNTLLNEQPTTAAAGGGRIGVGGFVRDQPVLSYLSNAQALPQPIRVSQPTPVYQQRDEHSNSNQMPFNMMMPALVGMLGQNGEVVPMVLPQLGGDIQSLVGNAGNRHDGQRRRGGNRFRNNHSNGNPFMAFRDNLKNFPFF